jgi:hypothetical protein
MKFAYDLVAVAMIKQRDAGKPEGRPESTRVRDDDQGLLHGVLSDTAIVGGHASRRVGSWRR